jgi:hypothetical protein
VAAFFFGEMSAALRVSRSEGTIAAFALRNAIPENARKPRGSVPPPLTADDSALNKLL